jgi:MFS family permease
MVGIFMNNQVSYSYRWVILALAWLMLFMHALMLQSIPPIMTTLANDMGLTYTQLGSLMGIGTLSSLVLAIPGGIWADRYGSRKVILIALGLYVVGISTLALSQVYLIMLIGRFTSGLGAAMMFVVAPMAVSGWFKGREIGLAMGVFNIAVPVGVFFAFNIFGMLVEQNSWRIVIWISALPAFLMLLAALLWFREPPESEYANQRVLEKQSNLHHTSKMSVWQLFKNTTPSTWLLSLAFFLYSASVFQVMTIGPAHFKETLGEYGRSDLVASMSMVASIFLSPVIGWLIDFTGRKDLLAYVAAIGSALLMIIIPTLGLNPILMMLILGIFIAMFLPAYYAYPVDIVKPQQMGFAFGLFSATFGLGIFCGSFMVGYLRDIMGNFTGAFFFMALVTLITIVPIYYVERGRRIIQAEEPPLK